MVRKERRFSSSRLDYGNRFRKKLLKIQIKQLKSLPIKDFSEQAYLNYSMYVILDRALPNISDGLKPVQRRNIIRYE